MQCGYSLVIKLLYYHCCSTDCFGCKLAALDADPRKVSNACLSDKELKGRINVKYFLKIVAFAALIKVFVISRGFRCRYTSIISCQLFNIVLDS